MIELADVTIVLGFLRRGKAGVSQLARILKQFYVSVTFL
jgi:hypothetical protein